MSKPQPKRGEGPFVLENSDGCSALSIPYRWITKNVFGKERKLSFLPYCIEHDEAYWYGGTWQQRREADNRLFWGIISCAKKAVWWAKPVYYTLSCLMWVVPRAIGSPRLPTPFRWMRREAYTKSLKYTVSPIVKNETVATQKDSEIVMNIVESEYIPEVTKIEEAVAIVNKKV